jgi:hypothetical protein
MACSGTALLFYLLREICETIRINAYGLEAVLWLRRLVLGVSSPRFASGSVHVRFAVDKVALEQVFLRVLSFSPVSIISTWFYMLICHLEFSNRSVCGRSSETSTWTPTYRRCGSSCRHSWPRHGERDDDTKCVCGHFALMQNDSADN